MEIVLSSGDSSFLTNPSHNIYERKRRENIRAERYYAKLLINGQLVGATRMVQLEWPSLVVNFNKVFKVFLKHYPDVVCIQIYRKRFVRNDHLISTIYIDIPGDKYDFTKLSLECLPLSMEWYKFSEASVINGNDGQDLVEGYASITSQWRKEKFPS